MKPHLEALYISKCRFGDPITAIGIGKETILHGSIMGRIVHYSLDTKTEKEIVDMSEEMVREIDVSNDDSYYYIANGDAGWLQLPENGLASYISLKTKWSAIHSDICERAYSFISNNFYCCIVLAHEDEQQMSYEEKIMLGDLTTTCLTKIKNDSHNYLPSNSIPCDFDGKRLLYLLIDLNCIVGLKLVKKEKKSSICMM